MRIPTFSIFALNCSKSYNTSTNGILNISRTAYFITRSVSFNKNLFFILIFSLNLYYLYNKLLINCFFILYPQLRLAFVEYCNIWYSLYRQGRTSANIARIVKYATFAG